MSLLEGLNLTIRHLKEKQQQPEKVVKMLESNLREDKAYQEPIFSQTSLESDLNSIEGVEIYF